MGVGFEVWSLGLGILGLRLEGVGFGFGVLGLRFGRKV
jgi:hypothetical protein